MRVLHLRASNFYGGPERQLHLHARRARGSAFDVTVASFTEHGQPPEFLQQIDSDGIATHAFEIRSAYDPRAIAQLRGYLRQQDVRVLCTHEYRTTVLGWLATRGTSTRWLAFSRGYTQTDLKIQLFQGLDKLLIRRADHLVAVSQAQKDRLCRLHIAPGRIAVVPNAIDAGELARVPAVDLRTRFGIPGDAILCVTGGRFSREKGQEVLVRAAALAVARDARLRFLLFGDGPDLPRVQQLATQLGLQDRVLCPGFERNIVGCLKGGDLLVNPSLSEGLPNIVLEAMAVGTPVVATAVGGVPEIVQDGVTGRLVRSVTPPAVAEALVAAAADMGRTRAMSEAARGFVAAECTFERQFEKLAALYRQLGEAPARRAD
jgi:glycosyltransferase involved in cell wall biosynthesis